MKATPNDIANSGIHQETGRPQEERPPHAGQDAKQLAFCAQVLGDAPLRQALTGLHAKNQHGQLHRAGDSKGAEGEDYPVDARLVPAAIEPVETQEGVEQGSQGGEAGRDKDGVVLFRLRPVADEDLEHRPDGGFCHQAELLEEEGGH